MTLGLVARGDLGGLAAQTEEVFRHLRPAKTLLVDLGPTKGRGHTRPERYWYDFTELRTTHGYPDTNAWRWLCDGIDTIYTAEGTYGPELPRIATRTGTRLIVHANPELWDEEYRGRTTVVTVPTTWEIDRVPRAWHLPMPVARDRLPFRRREQARTFLHMMAPAMEDRNGWRLLDAALRLVTSRINVVVAGNLGRLRPRRIGKTPVEALGPQTDYWTVYDQADALILPRRYGGLSLPIQEAMSAGMPIITLDLEPYAPMLHPAGLVPAVTPKTTRMRNGDFAVWNARPRQLAQAIDRLAFDPTLAQECSDAADAAASKLSWDALLPEWHRVLG